MDHLLRVISDDNVLKREILSASTREDNVASATAL